MRRFGTSVVIAIACIWPVQLVAQSIYTFVSLSGYPELSSKAWRNIEIIGVTRSRIS